MSYFSSELPFLNFLKLGSGWFGTTTIGNSFSESQGAFNLDSNGYPTSMVGTGPAAGQTFSQIKVLILRNLGLGNPDGSQTGPYYPSGNYALLYSGTGTFNFDFDCTNANIVSSAPGRIVINIPNPSYAGCQIDITSEGSGSNYITNMAFISSPDSTATNIGTNESAYNGGEIFNPVFIAKISEFKTLRFMDWGNTNSTPQTNWSDRAIPSQVFYGIHKSPTQSDPLGDGVPAEVMIALCNKIHADGWFNMPPLATDDYITQFATLAHNRMTSDLRAYVEYGNEIWNNGALATFNNLVTLGQAAIRGDTGWSAGFDYGILRAVQAGKIWKTTWGADGSRVIRLGAGQAAYVARNQYILQFTAPTYFSGSAGQNFDAFAIAPYFGYNAPASWTADADGGLNKLFTEMTKGGILPTGTGAPTSSGTATAYTLTSGLNLPATPSNQILIQFIPNVANGVNATLSVDGGTAYPLLDNEGNVLASGSLSSGSVTAAAFTSATASGTATTPGWRIVNVGYPGGMIKQALDWSTRNQAVIAPYGIPMVGYESGQSLVDYLAAIDYPNINNDLQTLYTDANRDGRMGQAYITYFTGWKNTGGGMINHLSNVGGYSKWGYWGALENVMETGSAKYNALLSFISANPAP